MIQTFAIDFRTLETMGICTANSRTTDNSVIGRRHLPLSLFDTSIQLCLSVHLRRRCRVDRTSFTEDSNLYIGCQEQRRSCVNKTVNSYFARNRTIRTCNKLKIMSGLDVMIAGCAMPKLHFCGISENFYHHDSCGKLIPSCSLPVMTFCSNWMWRPHTTLLHNTLAKLLPGLCSCGVSQNYPYARFMMACFQQMFRHTANCVCSHASVCNSNSTSTEYRPFVSCYSSVGYHCVSEANCPSSSVSVLNDCNGASSSGDDTCNATNESEVVQHGNMSANVSSSNKTEILSLGCSATVPNHFVTASITDDDADDSDDDDDDNDDHDDAHSLTKATNIVSSAPYCDVERQTSTDGDRMVSSFFIRASDSDASNYSDSDVSDDDDDDDEWDAEAASDDDESDCWCCDDDESWTSHVSTTHCVFVDLDPLKINGLYIPQTSNVPVSPSRCQSLPLELTAEVETESERALKLLNDRWQQWYSDDVKMRPTSRLQHDTKHVCIFSIFTVL